MKASEQSKTSAGSVARSYFEAISRRDLDAMVEHWAPGGSGYIHGMVNVTVPYTYRPWFQSLFDAFPDWRFEVLDLVSEGELAAVRWRARATFSGEGRFEGLEPNGAAIETEGCDVLTVRDGLIQSNYAYTNGMELSRRLGVLPAAGSAQEKAMLGALNLKTRIAARFRR